MKRPYMKVAAILGAVAFLLASGFARTEDHTAGTTGCLRSATCYSDDWVINFQNSESRHMDQELAYIAQDGFNNITLVIPWREPQPGMSPCTYNQYARDKLDRVMDTAAARGLSVMLKVGYTWDYCGTGNVVDRYRGLMQEGTERPAWLKYVGRLYQATSSRKNFCGGFLTWEDSWNFTDTSVSLGEGIRGRSMVRDCGYVGYVRENYELEELGEMYGHKLSGYDDLYFPTKDSQARGVFYGFYDQLSNELPADSQTVFPDLSMEVRPDADPAEYKDGSREGLMYSSTLPSGGAAYTSMIYGIPMGSTSEYEHVMAAEALEKVPVFLNHLRVHSGGKLVYLDQFLFTDNIVGYEYNAQLRDDEKSLHLEGVVPTLRNSTMGYGIWTHRDYGDNKLFNAQFALGADGWRFSEGSYIVGDENGKSAMTPSSGNIYQNLGSRMIGNTGKDTCVRLRTGAEEKCRLTMRMSSQTRTMDMREERKVGLKSSSCQPSDFTISVNGGKGAYVDDVRVYTFVTQRELYNMDGSEGRCIEVPRLMNQKLQSVHTILVIGKNKDQKKEVGMMTKLERGVKNCLHNADNCCCRAAIAVGGNKAKTAEQTCHASLDENKGGKSTNLFKTPETRLEIAYDAVRRVYNEEHRCSAKRIDISGDKACECTETRCSTFKAR